MTERVRRRIYNWPAREVGVAYAVFGVAMIFQSERFSATPSYHNLIRILPAPAWGAMYLVVAALLAAWVFIRSHRLILAVIAHTAAAMLTVLWLMAFVIRYLTDTATTAVNVVSWSVFLALIVRSATNAFDEDDDPAS